jgi:inositol hexakisphosphate/diphosphoinositol-pentakisphosphate kinase
MGKKTKSKPMDEIVKRIKLFEFVQVEIFEENQILNDPVEEWPICDCLISFHSKGFPLDKALQYEKLRKPFVINDLEKQWDIQDRVKVYETLTEAGIETPR